MKFECIGMFVPFSIFLFKVYRIPPQSEKLLKLRVLELPKCADLIIFCVHL